MTEEREVSQHIFAIMMKELNEKEYLADICKVAILKYFAGRAVDQKSENILRGYLREMCEKGMIFAFYMDYPKQWLREVHLYDKFIVEYHASSDSKVKIVYSIDDKTNKTEILLPVYQNTYIKEFILYGGETLKYCFREENKDFLHITEKEVYTQQNLQVQEGKYGRLNHILQLPDEERLEAMVQYTREEELAREIFTLY